MTKRKRAATAAVASTTIPFTVPLPPEKSLSVHEQIERIRETDEDGSLVFGLMEEIDESVLEAYGFRHLSPSTIARQDSHLRIYRNYIKLRFRCDPLQADDETDLLGFPDNQDDLIFLVRGFLSFIFLHVKGRIRKSGYQEKMTYRSLTQYRSSMLFWVPRLLSQRGIDPPRQALLFNALTEQMRYVYHKHGAQQRRAPLAGLGLVELRQIIEHAMTTTRSIELTEQFAAICCMARQTAVRPGSIGWSKGRKGNYLKWRNVKFINHGSGNWTVIITFTHLKTNMSDPEQGEWRSLDCYLDSPNEDNLIFSVPHRLLMMALRRDLIDGITTIEELVQSNLAEFTIKDENLDDPIFYAGLPGGRGIDTSLNEDGQQRALSASQISAWVSSQGRALGYTEAITLYSFRRRAASDLVELVGYEMTREIMGHSPHSSTLERYYVNIRARIDLTSATLNQPVGPSGFKAGQSTYAPVAATQLPKDTIDHIRNVGVNQLLDEMMDRDPNYPASGTDAELKLYRRRLRAYALRVLIDQAKDATAKSQTLQDKAAQQEQWAKEATSFAAAVTAQAQTLLEQNAAIDVDQVEAEAGVVVSDDLDEGDQDALNQPPEQDMEDAVDSATSNYVTYRVAGEEFQPVAGTVPFVTLVTAFMQILEQNLYSETEKPWKTRASIEKLCPLCLGDATVTKPKDLNRVWRDQDSLINHMDSGSFHTPYAQWLRAVKLDAAEYKKQNPTATAIFQCGYADSDKPHSFNVLSHLTRHIRNVLASKGSSKAEKREYQRIVDDGWEDTVTWMGVPSVSAQRDNLKTKTKTLREAGVERVLETRPYCHAKAHPTIPDVMLGDVAGAGLARLPEHLRPFVTFGGPLSALPVHIESFVGPAKTSARAPRHLQQYIAWGPPTASTSPTP